MDKQEKKVLYLIDRAKNCLEFAVDPYACLDDMSVYVFQARKLLKKANYYINAMMDDDYQTEQNRTEKEARNEQ